MSSFHPLRTDKEITDTDECLGIIAGQQHLTIAMCKGNEPYLATLNYGFDDVLRCFYFHCATRGKKLDFLRANPLIWGQVMDDRGYLAGECSYAYRTVQFQGRVEIIEDEEEKRAALRLMVQQREPDPDPVRQRMVENRSLEHVVVGRIRILEMSGKRSPVESAG